MVSDIFGERSNRLLLIEDNAGDARLLQEMLKEGRTPFRVAVEPSIEAAYQRSATEEFDLILSDLGLPGSHGLQTFELCRAKWPDKPIVVLSGVSDEEVAEEAVRSGAQDYLVKGGINARALSRALCYALERHRSAEERRSLVRELEQSRKLEAIGQLAAGVAHEINTPTQYVSDNARFLRDAFQDVACLLKALESFASSGKALDPQALASLFAEADVEYLQQEIPRALEQSLEGLEHVARIVRAMKEFSHPASDEKTPTDLNKAINTTITVASNEWKYVADVDTQLDDSLPAVPCLPGEIYQVLLNLIVNAAHAIEDALGGCSESKGKISVGTSVTDSCAVIRVADTGTGVPEGIRERVFDPFFTTKDVGKGTGQGLAIAYNVVVNKHGGRIDLGSADGGGAVFTISLPLVDSEASSDS